MTLSEFSLQARVMMKLGIVFVVGIIIVYLGILALLSMRSSTPQPVPTAVPQLTFGKIPRLELSSLAVKSPSSYVLDTLDGEYPASTTEAKIYFVPEGTVTLASTKEADVLAANFGFTPDTLPIRVNDTTAEYSDNSKKLLYDKKDKTYTFSYKPEGLQPVIEATPSASLAPIEELIKSQAISLMQQKHLQGSTTNSMLVTYDLAQNRFIPTEEQPQAIRIDFFKPNLNGIPIVSPYYFTSQNYIIMAPLNEQARMVEMQYKSFDPIMTTDQFGATYPGVYPVVSVEEAWGALEKGEASIVSYTPSSSPVRIKDIFLAYYDGADYQQYYQPVYVFLGSDNFVAYFPAVKPEYTGNGT